jgi:TolA-binding protein
MDIYRGSGMKLIVGSMTVCLATLSLVCCSAAPDSQSQAQIDSLRNEVDGLKQQLSTSQSNFDQLKSTVDQLNNQLSQSSQNNDEHETADFDPVTDQGYQLLDIGIGRVMVVVQNITPFADGARVELLIGNPNAVTIDGLQGQITYGPSLSKIQAGMSIDEWNKAQRTTPTQITNAILPGRWNEVLVTLPGVSTNELGRIRLKLVGNQVRLMR